MLAPAPKQHSLYAPVEPAPVYRLVDEKTGEEITLPARLKCWDGAEIVVRDFAGGTPGRVYTTMNEVFVPSVVDAKIVRTDSCGGAK